MFQCKIDEFCSDMPNVFGIVDDILVIAYDENGADHDAVIHNVLRHCKEVKLKLNKDKCHFRCMQIPFFGEVISRDGVQAEPQKIKVLMDMLAPKNKKDIGLLRHNKLSWKILSRYHRCM